MHALAVVLTVLVLLLSFAAILARACRWRMPPAGEEEGAQPGRHARCPCPHCRARRRGQ